MGRRRGEKGRAIEVVGADANNLRDVDVQFPLNEITVVTGVSGSGKSSLLADTLAAEGSRRMRLFLGTSQEGLERDDVAAFIGRLPPTVLVGQRGFRASIRSTIGTATGFLSVLRRLFVSVSAPFSEVAHAEVPAASAILYAGWLARYHRGPLEVWAVPVRNQKTDGTIAVGRLASHGVETLIIRSETDPLRLRESGRQIDVSTFKGLNAAVRHTIEARIGASVVKGEASRAALEVLLRRAFNAANDHVVVMLPGAEIAELAGPFGHRLDSTKHRVHPGDPAVFAHPTAHLLSFNAPEHEDSGACRACAGTGVGRRLLEETLISHPERSMHGGAFALWTDKNYKYVNIQHDTIEGLRGMRDFSPDVPWARLPEAARRLVLDGSAGELVVDRDPSGRKVASGRPFPGFRRIILEKAAGLTKTAISLSTFVEVGPCDACKGSRWSLQARALKVGGWSIDQLLGMTFAKVEVLAGVDESFARSVGSGARSLIGAVGKHAHAIVSVGLGYLTGDRGMSEVSEGESRRIRLARVLDARERGLCLLLDEPARGLHEADLPCLGDALERLRGDHTVIMNEHRERLWDIADWHVEIGPGAGAAGGEIAYQGPRPRRDSNGDQPLRKLNPVEPGSGQISIRGATIHNVKGVDCDIPLGRLTCICGVSGSGKSSFIRGVLAPALARVVESDLSGFAIRRGSWRSIKGTSRLGEVIALDQAMPTPNRRSLIATFIGVFDEIRSVFGNAPDAKRDGLTASDFGVNAGNGRCRVCSGIGEIEQHETWSDCPTCGGARYGRAALAVRIKGVNVQELLDIPFEHVAEFSDAFRIPARLVRTICDLELGYVTLGRRVDTLSGGEVQRLRLALRLGAERAQPTCFILDEPAVGLHPRDVAQLAKALERVRDGGRNTIIMVEHDLRLIRSSDWVIEFGPGSGPDGGQIVYSGPPDEQAKARTATGLALGGMLPESTSVQKRKRRNRIREESFGHATLSIDEQVARTNALLRTLLTGEAKPSPQSDINAGATPIEPVVVVSDRFWSGLATWEVAGLDIEIPKLLLSARRAQQVDVFAEILELWNDRPASWLAINPFLTEMQVWGAELPASSIRAVSRHVEQEGLRLVTYTGDEVGDQLDVRHVRATGARFVPDNASELDRRRVLQDAFAIGARYAELREAVSGRLRATASERILDLETGLVAPMSPLPVHFTRLDPRGRCPMCDGRRTVTALIDPIVMARPDLPPDDDRFLTPEANAVLKGVVRNELRPFLKRLAAEGLWDPKVSFESLSKTKQELVRHGFWARPGPGTFLKSTKDDASQVSSWLRWDGLFRHVLDQASRSRDLEWVAGLRESRHTIICPKCEGSGLREHAELLCAGGKSLGAALRRPKLNKVRSFVAAIETKRPRDVHTKRRIVYCLSPAAGSDSASEAGAVVDRAVETFTTLTPVKAPGVSED